MITIRNPNVPGAIVEGSSDHPVNLNDHLFGPIITEVHWNPGGVGVVEMTHVPGTSNLICIDPADAFAGLRFEAGATVSLPDDIKDDFFVKTDIQHDEGPWRAENPFDVLWVDGWFLGPNSDQDALNAARDSGTATFGYPPNLEVIDAFAVFRTDTIIQPDGHKVSYYGHYTIELNWYATTDGYGNPTTDPDPIVSYADNDSTELVWYHKTTQPPVDYEKVKENWLINFASDKAKTMQIFTALVICEFTIRVFSGPVKCFLNSDGTVAVTNIDGTPAIPKWQAAGSQENGPLINFTSSGILPST